jgi:hypothetical protein
VDDDMVVANINGTVARELTLDRLERAPLRFRNRHPASVWSRRSVRS